MKVDASLINSDRSGPRDAINLIINQGPLSQSGSIGTLGQTARGQKRGNLLSPIRAEDSQLSENPLTMKAMHNSQENFSKK
jgi:hypothetical protein